MAWVLLDLLFHVTLPAAVILVHLLASPYTKVEESFSLQATYDILRHGIPTADITSYLAANYDHFSFPGAVPRSFLGPLVLAGLSRPFTAVFGGIVNEQVVVRGVLGLLTALALSLFSYRARSAYGPTTARFYVVLQLIQFHLPYYASRTLPNTFALIVSLIAQSFFLPSPASSRAWQHIRYKLGIYGLVLGGIIFRSELALLLFFRVAHLIVTRRVSVLRDVVPAGIAGGVLGLAITLGVDSYFWQSHTSSTPFTTPFLTEKFGLLWPEFSAFWYNAVDGHASDWGTAPWHHYFSSALPKLLLNPAWVLTLFLPFYTTPASAVDLALPNVLFMTAYSLLPHKEWRFIIYAVPELTLLSALGCSWVWTRRSKHPAYALLVLALLATIPATALVSLAMLIISSMNYPGGGAVSALHAHLPPAASFAGKIHLDVPVCMTGATRFLMEAPLFPLLSPSEPLPLRRFDKTEDPAALLRPAFWEDIEYAVVATPETLIGRYEQLHAVPGFRRVRLYRPGEAVHVAPVRIADEVAEEAGLPVGETQYENWWQRALGDGFGVRALLRGWWVGVEREEMIFILKRQPLREGEKKEAVV